MKYNNLFIHQEEAVLLFFFGVQAVEGQPQQPYVEPDQPAYDYTGCPQTVFVYWQVREQMDQSQVWQQGQGQEQGYWEEQQHE